MYIGIPVALGGGGVQKAGLIFACQVQSIPGSLGADIQGLGTEPGVIGRAGRGCEIEEIIDLPQIKGLADILLHQGESRFILQVREVGGTPRSKIVHAHHPVPLGQKSVTEMRAEEAGSAGDQDTMSRQNAVSPVLESIQRIALQRIRL
jgi:hypothetical protein